jgi:putative heme degradation protein
MYREWQTAKILYFSSIKSYFSTTQKDAHTPQHSLDIFSQQGNAVARGTFHKSINIKFLFV